MPYYFGSLKRDPINLEKYPYRDLITASLVFMGLLSTDPHILGFSGGFLIRFLHHLKAGVKAVI